MSGEQRNLSGVPEAELAWAEEIVDATHPGLAHLSRWPLAIARGATAGAVAAAAVGATLAPQRLAGFGLASLLLWTVPPLAALWITAVVTSRTAASARAHLVGAVAGEAMQRGRGAACLLAMRLRPGAPAAPPVIDVPLGIGPWRRRTAAAGRADEIVASARGAGRRALSAMTALASLSWAPEPSADAAAKADEVGVPGVGQHVI